MKDLRRFIKTTIREFLNESVNTYQILYDVAEELSKKMYCDKLGSCVHFAEEFVLKINETHPQILNDFFVIEGYVNWEYGDDIPQQHTWIELKDGTKIDPTYEQFTKYGWANYFKKKQKKHTGLEYYTETLSGTWFSDRRQKYPEQFFKEEYDTSEKNT